MRGATLRGTTATVNAWTGRNIWGTSDLARALVAFRGVIHDRLLPEAALARAGLT